MIAPFDFLGPAYDDQLKQAFTTVKDANIYRKHSLLGALSSGSFTSNAPLAKMLDKYITNDVLAKIAREPVKGRRLFIRTTNLDADRHHLDASKGVGRSYEGLRRRDWS